LRELCSGLREDPNSFSEPDVIVDFGEHGVMFIEVKHQSGNDLKPFDYAGWPRYPSAAPLAWRIEDVKRDSDFFAREIEFVDRGTVVLARREAVDLGRLVGIDHRQQRLVERATNAAVQPLQALGLLDRPEHRLRIHEQDEWVGDRMLRLGHRVS
jgi:hypothetical protein